MREYDVSFFSASGLILGGLTLGAVFVLGGAEGTRTGSGTGLGLTGGCDGGEMFLPGLGASGKILEGGAIGSSLGLLGGRCSSLGELLLGVLLGTGSHLPL